MKLISSFVAATCVGDVWDNTKLLCSVIELASTFGC